LEEVPVSVGNKHQLMPLVDGVDRWFDLCLEVYRVCPSK
jgi:hypothetical protein